MDCRAKAQATRRSSCNDILCISAVRLFFAASLFVVAALASRGTILPEIPKRLAAALPDRTLFAERPVAVSVSSRRLDNPDKPEDLARLRKVVLKYLESQHFTVVSDRAAPALLVELIVEPNVRYGEFHYQNAPYVYLTIRTAATQQLVYCAYERASHFYSATGRLLRNFGDFVRHPEAAPDGSLKSCAEQAMRPL